MKVAGDQAQEKVETRKALEALDPAMISHPNSNPRFKRAIYVNF